MTTDAELIDRSLTDAEAFGELYDRHHVALVAWASRACGDREVAREVVAETFAQAFVARRRYRPHPSGSALPWLFGIAHNLVRRMRRTQRIDTAARTRLGIPTDLVVDIADEVDERLALDQLAADLATAMRALPSAQREALLLRYRDDLPFDAVAEKLGCTPVNARVRVTRALATLRLGLEDRSS